MTRSALYTTKAPISDVSNMLRFHALGLQRVSRVIDGNVNYDEIMEHRLGDRHWAIFHSSADVEVKRSEAIALFEKQFRRNKPKAMVPEFSGFVCEGNTRNNLREFEFFERLCAPVGIEILHFNYSNCESIAISDLSSEQIEARDKISSDIAAFYNARGEITASLVRQQILYSRSFFSFLLAFSRPGIIRPTALVQANDHSPVRVALSMVMKGLEIPRIYLQHAEVTQSFPELEFEYSVLRNARSLETYENIGPIGGEVFVIGREERAFARELLFRKRDDNMMVVVYPTSRVLVDQTVRIVRELQNNPSVTKVVVKQHPAAANALSVALEAIGAELLKEIPECDHIAIVGNSSIAIELLHRGVPVYQNFDFDPVSADYYGFVTDGLTYRVELSDLSREFWRAFPPSEDWIGKFSRWDPTAVEGHVNERARFVDEMARIGRGKEPSPAAHARSAPKGRLKARAKAAIKRTIIGAINSSPKLSEFVANHGLSITDRVARFLLIGAHNAARFFHVYTDLTVNTPIWQNNGGRRPTAALPEPGVLELIEYTLARTDLPSEWIRLNDKTRTFTSLAMIQALDQMFQGRNPALNAVFRDHSAWTAGSAVRTWIHLKKAEWGYIAIDHDEIDEISAFTFGYDDDARVRAVLESMLLSSILRCGTCEQLDHFWRDARIKKESLSVNRKIDVLRKLRSAPERKAEADKLRSLFEAQASPFELLKLRNADILEGRRVEGWDHRRVEQEFERVAPRKIAQEFASYVSPIYDGLRPRMRLIDVRTDPQLSDEFMELARKAIKNKAPFSLVRLSDGEGYIFPERRFFSELDAANRERHWWGSELPKNLRQQVADEARRAVMTADVVGIPTVYRFVRDNGDHSTSLVRALQGRGLLEVLNGIPDTISPQALISEDKINVALFSNVEAMVPLADLARKIVVVTSAKAQNLPATLVADRRMEIVTIPTHHKTRLNAKYYSDSKPLPFVYSTVVQKLDELIEPGDLVLVAGGVVGKIFVGYARAKGAVALDIGHTLDDWIHGHLPALR